MTSHRILQLNAVSTAACGVGMLATRGTLHSFFGLDTPTLLDLLALGLLLYAGALAFAARRQPVTREVLMAFTVADGLWVVDSSSGGKTRLRRRKIQAHPHAEVASATARSSASSSCCSRSRPATHARAPGEAVPPRARRQDAACARSSRDRRRPASGAALVPPLRPRPAPQSRRCPLSRGRGHVAVALCESQCIATNRSCNATPSVPAMWS